MSFIFLSKNPLARKKLLRAYSSLLKKAQNANNKHLEKLLISTFRQKDSFLPPKTVVSVLLQEMRQNELVHYFKVYLQTISLETKQRYI